jgi:hypothetical protein
VTSDFSLGDTKIGFIKDYYSLRNLMESGGEMSVTKLVRVGEYRMDVLAHCRAMAAFCRQRVAFENENDAFWIREAETQSLLLLMAFCQRLGDVFMAGAARVHGRHVRIASKREPQMR